MSLQSAAIPTAPAIVLPGFDDGLGRRYRPVARGDDEVPAEILCFRPELTEVASFEFALRERVASLADFRHPSYARIRKVDRLSDERGTVAMTSYCAPGVRLSEILKAAERGDVVLDLNAALCLARQLASAMAVLHEQARVAHGAIAPERLIVTPDARLFIVEYVMGAALEQLRYSRERYWNELRVALPMSPGLPRFDMAADLPQMGVVVLSLVLGRPLRDAEYPAGVENLVEPLPHDIRDWLRRVLQLDPRSSFKSLREAQGALNKLLSDEPKYSADAASLEEFLERYRLSTLPPAQAPAPSPRTASVSAASVAVVPLAPSAPPASVSCSSQAVVYPDLDADPDPETDETELTEGEDSHPMTPSHSRQASVVRNGRIAAGLALAVVMTAGLVAARARFSPAAPAVTTGSITLETSPPGAQVEVDGAARGLSPISLALPPGAHTLTVRGSSGELRTVPITIAAGAQISQYIELPKAAAAAGQLQVRSEPSAARVSVDGVAIGDTPLTLLDLTPGEHSVKLESDLGSVTQKVTIEAGITSSLFVPLSSPQGAQASGWMSVSAPLEVQLFEQSRLLGSSGIDRIMLPTGRHDIELVNEFLGYRETRTVQITPGKVSSISVTLPKGAVSLNAVPWASVTIDGESVGDTPIGNLSITVGPHEVIFRHPQLGEQRRVITVTAHAPVRLSVDLNKK